MTYTMKVWNHPTTGEVRLYVNGTTRQSVYLREHKFAAGRVSWGSKAADTPHKFQTGNHYQKVDKDADAAHEVAQAYGAVLGEDGPAEGWAQLVNLANRGIEIDPDAADGEAAA